MDNVSYFTPDEFDIKKFLLNVLNNGIVIEILVVNPCMSVIVELNESLKQLLRSNDKYQISLDLENEESLLIRNRLSLMKQRYIVTGDIDNILSKASMKLANCLFLFLNEIHRREDMQCHYHEYDHILPFFKVRFVYSKKPTSLPFLLAMR